ncbi:Glycosyltransferase [Melia azedarach]|uniref:Glycosyltransferase n=1 Tax=Melia azedarach TaxID=155640 RepID=A0ACC1YNI7_MELAZ|nr:Glycosyltransferase [Melia azedarach]
MGCKAPIGFDINSEFKDEKWLPEGFEGRIKDSGRGLVIHKWAPQVEILSHKSVSAFFSHCGWNSVLEALTRGVPIIGWPLAAEQFYNSKLLEEEIEVCVEVARGMNFEVLKEDMVEKIELVMNETPKGKEMRRKASEVKEIIENAVRNEENFQGSSVKAMDQFLNAALMMRESKLGGSNPKRL